jgi:hypothetical protein
MPTGIIDDHVQIVLHDTSLGLTCGLGFRNHETENVHIHAAVKAIVSLHLFFLVIIYLMSLSVSIHYRTCCLSTTGD